MQFTLLESSEPEGSEKLLRLTHNFIRNEPSHTQHFETVIAISDNGGVAVKMVKDRKAVRGKTTDPARGLAMILRHHAFKALMAMGERRNPHMGKVWARHKFWTRRAVGIYRHLVYRRIYLVGSSTPLYPTKMPIRFVVYAPDFFGDKGPIHVRDKRCVSIHMDAGRKFAFVCQQGLR